MDAKPAANVRGVASEFRSGALSPASAVPDAAQPGAGLLLRNRHLVHLHRQCNRGVVAEQDEHFRDALAAQHLFDLGEFGVRQIYLNRIGCSRLMG